MPASANPKYRHRLPQLDDRLFLTDGGLETTLIFHEGWDLPMFQAFTLLESERGSLVRQVLDLLGDPGRT